MRYFFINILFSLLFFKASAIEKHWAAKWIWAEEELQAEAVMARKSFELGTSPKQAIVKITASDFYQLYINGQYVNRGAARSAAHHQSYDCIDVKGFLREGKNLIAVRVVFEPGAQSYQFEARAGLLVQMEVDNQVIVSDDSWRLMEDSSWDKESPVISRFQRDVCDNVDMRSYSHAWFTGDFDDSSWSFAHELMRNAGWPAHQKGVRATASINPWIKLVKRDIPMLKEELLLKPTLILTKNYLEYPQGLVSEKVLLDGTVDKAISRGISKKERFELVFQEDEKGRLLLFDFGKVMNGFPLINIEGISGTQIRVLCAPYVLNNHFCASLVDAKYEDRITLSGKRDLWEASYFKPCRYMAVWVENSGYPVTINQIALRHISYPFEQKGLMESADAPWVKDFFTASAKTIEICTTDAITDNYRERRQYAQTGYYGALGNYYIFGGMALQRRYLIQIAQEQMADGIMPAYAPLATSDYMVILDSNCFWLKSLWNYYLYSGDEKTVRQLLPAAERLLELLHGFTNEHGLIDNPPYAYWLDHAVNDRSGANFTLNAHYLEALENYSELLNWLKEESYDGYMSKAKTLRGSLQKLFWNEESGLFVDAVVDGKQSMQVSEHANAMALALHIATQEQGNKISQNIVEEDNDFVKRNSGMTTVTPAMSYYLHKGLCEYGSVKASFELLNKRFNHMLAENTNQTLWEEWWLHGSGRTGKFMPGKTRSDAQTESAFPPALFAGYLFGLEPVEPGLKRWALKYIDSGVENLKGVIPVGNAQMQIEWKVGKKQSLKLVIPQGIQIDVDIKSLDAKGTVWVNKQELRGDATTMNLTEGEYNITF
ncbi:family 78 glycoside hydrolase catalytic domain [Carboxylicivirga mesophila]|uniref:Family 78 glycoside hydrolase catalytic domain n=1 Tax=Carboxylicivirga mesophila TaxID=1166478 RepID=A0ABS5K8E9_9BACT|nr:family 78 glycoside hydrolase catalytic domain [Carboxylicivirga mesophila]